MDRCAVARLTHERPWRCCPLERHNASVVLRRELESKEAAALESLVAPAR